MSNVGISAGASRARTGRLRNKLLRSRERGLAQERAATMLLPVIAAVPLAPSRLTLAVERVVQFRFAVGHGYEDEAVL
jgi:hypothetical protein